MPPVSPGIPFAPGNAPLLKLIHRANRRIWDAMRQQGVDLRHKENLWCTSLAVVRVGTGEFEWVQSGDSLILTIDDNGSYQVLVPDHCHDLETLCMWRGHGLLRHPCSFRKPQGTDYRRAQAGERHLWRSQTGSRKRLILSAGGVETWRASVIYCFSPTVCSSPRRIRSRAIDSTPWWTVFSLADCNPYTAMFTDFSAAIRFATAIPDSSPTTILPQWPSPHHPNFSEAF